MLSSCEGFGLGWMCWCWWTGCVQRYRLNRRLSKSTKRGTRMLYKKKETREEEDKMSWMLVQIISYSLSPP